MKKRFNEEQIIQILREADRLADRVERLAYSTLLGGVRGKAVAYCRRAGDKAVARSASREAVACFEQALAPLGAWPGVLPLLGRGGSGRAGAVRVRSPPQRRSRPPLTSLMTIPPPPSDERLKW